MSTPPPAAPEHPSPRWAPWILFLGVFVLAFILLPDGSPRKSTSLTELRRALRDGEVSELEVFAQSREVRGILRGADESAFRTPIATEELLTELLRDVETWNASRAEGAVEVTVLPPPNRLLISLVETLPWLLFAGVLLWWMFRQSRALGGPGGPSLSARARAQDGELPSVTFDDVMGAEEAKEEVYELVEFLQHPERFRRLGGRMPRGVLLVGPPGTGKTLLAKAVAGEAGVPFFCLSGSDFVEMFVGVGASRARELFRLARESAPCIIFLDEIDAVGRRRGHSSLGGSEEREQTLNALLVEMDGFDSEDGVIVVAATNRPDVLDPALLRPGRFDREIVLDLPDMKGRQQILELHARRVCLSGEVDLDAVARGTPMFSGADLEALVNEAALIAARERREGVTPADFEEARDKVRWGRARTSRVLEEDDRRITAYHEAGHAILAHLIPEVEPLHKVTIIPRGPALGATLQLPERDRYSLSRSTAVGNLVVLFGGRVAEQHFCGDETSGASNDLQRASDLARRMVCEWGMSTRIGPVAYRTGYDEEQPGIAPLGEETRRQIDAEIRRTLVEAYAEAESMIERHSRVVEAIAQALLARETLTGDEVEAILRQTECLAVG